MGMAKELYTAPIHKTSEIRFDLPTLNISKKVEPRSAQRPLRKNLKYLCVLRELCG
jgi:hypothetical protein